MRGGLASVEDLVGEDATAPGYDAVVISVPTDGSYLGVLRTATAGIAARLLFALDEIEDLRIAVDEACGMLLPVAAAGGELTCRFEIGVDALAVEVSVPTDGTVQLPSAQSFAWQVLTALAADVTATAVAGRAAIRLASRGATMPTGTS
jgi:serine/threonine-protein kinase RsbW